MAHATSAASATAHAKAARGGGGEYPSTAHAYTAAQTTAGSSAPSSASRRRQLSTAAVWKTAADNAAVPPMPASAAIGRQAYKMPFSCTWNAKRKNASADAASTRGTSAVARDRRARLETPTAIAGTHAATVVAAHTLLIRSTAYSRFHRNSGFVAHQKLLT